MNKEIEINDTVRNILTNQENECYICLGDIELNKEDIILTKCNHLFHYDCLYQTIKGNMNINSKYGKELECPYCRSKLQNLPNYKPDLYPKLGYYMKKKIYCTAILKSGKRKGQTCNAVVQTLQGKKYCGRHKNYVAPVEEQIFKTDPINNEFKCFLI